MTPTSEASVRPVFATTHWSDVQLFHEAGAEANAARDRLARAYWFPLYVYARRCLWKHGGMPAEAEDLVQSFFLHLSQKSALQDANPGRGLFRNFLLASFRHFMADHWKHTRRFKCRPPGGWVPLDEPGAEQRFLDEFACCDSPDRAYDRACALNIVERVLQQLRHEYAATSRADLFTRIEPLLQSVGDTSPYVDLARNAGLTRGAFKIAVHRCRVRFRELLDIDLARSVGWLGRDHRALKRDFGHDAQLQQRVEDEKAHLLAALC